MHMKRLMVLFLLVTLLAGILVGCGSNYSSAKPGQCMWCDGYGYASYYDSDGNLRSKTCSHCGGTGRS